MALSDMIYLVVVAFLLVVVVLASDYTFKKVIPLIQDDIPANTSTQINATWTTTTNFFNGSFVVIFISFGVVSLILASRLSSSPTFLLLFVLLNLLVLWFYDGLVTFLNPIMDSPLNTGVMSAADTFIKNDLPKAIIILNIIAAIVLYGKNKLSGEL